ncbi:pyridine nucleotide-disulfide oxidoreductase [Candidatus Poribacteria bacterium]|nr:pyridine nucleotide-disulfide oxidoreductase [Candidatus Poribacteria bacterium]
MRLLIIGGGAGGPASASRARRLDEDAEIIMLERGEHISYGHCGLPYHIGGVIKNRSELLISNPENFKQVYNVDVRVRSLVKNINAEEKYIEVVDLNTGDSYNEEYDKLILSSGANPIKPPLPGIDLDGIFTLRNLTDTDKINQYIKDKNPKSAVVVGGGFIGLEMAENFNHLGMDVTIVELLDQLMPPLDPEMADIIHKTMKLHSIKLALSDPVAGFQKQNGKIIAKLESGREIPTDIVMLSIGVKPNLELAKAADLEIGKSGGIKVDQTMRTSDPNIYSVGDAVESKHLVTGEPVVIPLAGPASRQARIAINNIYGREDKYKGVLGTSLVKIFELAVGTVGVNEKTLKRLGIDYEKCYLHPFSHVTYYPDASQMNMKLLFSPKDGNILGAQILGSEGVDKRIDTLASAISGNMTVDDLTDLELGYVPPYGSAREVVNIAGYIASNIISGDMPVEHWENLDELMSGDGIFLDVREKDVIGVGSIPGAKNIPLRELRENLDDLPKEVPIYVYCNVGVESYIATRMLVQNGFDARNMSGGYGIYKCQCRSDEDAQETIDSDYSEDVSQTKSSDTEPERQDQNASMAQLDACGLQCPGPIMKVKQKMDELNSGNILEVTASDTGFATDLPAWCRSVGHEVLSIEVKDGRIVGRVKKRDPDSPPADLAESSPQDISATPQAREKTIVVFSNDMDRIMAAFIIANGSASMGYKVNMFFTFWGLNVLRKSEKVKVKKTFMERMFTRMMPRGSSKLKLSKLNMGGMGTSMMKGVMRKKNVHSPEELIKMAMDQGVRLIACTMTMGIMGIHKEELLDGVEEGGVAAFLENADHSNMTLFI